MPDTPPREPRKSMSHAMKEGIRPPAPTIDTSAESKDDGRSLVTPANSSVKVAPISPARPLD